MTKRVVNALLRPRRRPSGGGDDSECARPPVSSGLPLSATLSSAVRRSSHIYHHGYMNVSKATHFARFRAIPI